MGLEASLRVKCTGGGGSYEAGGFIGIGSGGVGDDDNEDGSRCRFRV